MCCSIWARGRKGLPGLGAARVWSRVTLEPNLSCHNKMMRSGPESLKSSAKCTQARALPSSCREQILLQKAPGHPILASSQRSRRSGAPAEPPSHVPLFLLAVGSGAFAASQGVRVCAFTRQRWEFCPQPPPAPAAGAAPMPRWWLEHLFGGTPGWGFACWFAGFCGDSVGPPRDRILRMPPLPSPQPGCAPAGSPRCGHWVALARLGTGAASRIVPEESTAIEGWGGGFTALPRPARGSGGPRDPWAPWGPWALRTPRTAVALLCGKAALGSPRRLLPLSKASPEAAQPRGRCPALGCSCVPPSQSPTPPSWGSTGRAAAQPDPLPPRSPHSAPSHVLGSPATRSHPPAPLRPPHPGNRVGITTHHLLKGCCQG